MLHVPVELSPVACPPAGERQDQRHELLLAFGVAQSCLGRIGSKHAPERDPPQVGENALPIGSGKAPGETAANIQAIVCLASNRRGGGIRRLQLRPVVLAQHDVTCEVSPLVARAAPLADIDHLDDLFRQLANELARNAQRMC